MPYRVTLFGKIEIGNTFRFQGKWFAKNRYGMAYQAGAASGKGGLHDGRGIALMKDSDIVGVMCDNNGGISRT